MARNESDKQSGRIRRKHLELATKGKVSGGGTRPYGFDVDRRTVLEWRLPTSGRPPAGCWPGIRGVRCVPTSTTGASRRRPGKPWTIQVMKRMLTSARISGRREHRGEIVADAEWPGIITPEDSDRLRGLRGRAAGPAPSGRTPRRYLLTGGLLRCGLCDTPMFSRPRTDGTRRYVCASGPGFGGCGRMARWPNRWRVSLSERFCIASIPPSGRRAHRCPASQRRERPAFRAGRRG